MCRVPCVEQGDSSGGIGRPKGSSVIGGEILQNSSRLLAIRAKKAFSTHRVAWERRRMYYMRSKVACLLAAVLFAFATFMFFSPGLARSAGKRILWDQSHGIYLDYRIRQQWKWVVGGLRLSGYTVDTLSTGPVTPEALENYDILVVTLVSNWYAPYSPDEIDAVSDWLAASPKGLLIIGDNPDTPNSNINGLGARFGVEFGVGPIDCSVDQNALGVPLDLKFTVGGALNVDTPSTPLCWDSEGNVGVAYGTSAGSRWVAIGDINAIAQGCFRPDATRPYQGHNPVFTYAVFRFLDPANPDLTLSLDTTP